MRACKGMRMRAAAAEGGAWGARLCLAPCLLAASGSMLLRRAAPCLAAAGRCPPLTNPADECIGQLGRGDLRGAGEGGEGAHQACRA